ncbi:hypothetical protein M8J77_015295 [Diaphorina citri]|nr:hypothetical protein M8J77_015295 [Diaphorina citri]
MCPRWYCALIPSKAKVSIDFVQGGTHIVEEEEVERALCNHVSTLVLCSNSEQSESSSSESESDEESSSSSDDKTLARSHSKIILDSDDTDDSE